MIDDITLSRWMKAALNAAIKGVANGQYPFGAAIFSSDGDQLALEHNRVNELLFPSAHAEVLAIRLACRVVNNVELKHCWLVATGEPCPMCTAAAMIAGIEHVAFGASEKCVAQAGYGSLNLTCSDLVRSCGLSITVRPNILQAECEALLLNHPHASFKLE